MGRRNQSPALFVVALLISSAATPPVHGQRLPLSQLDIAGKICCTSTGNCRGNNEPGIPGAVVTFACRIPGIGAGYITTGTTRTDTDGVFFINVKNTTDLFCTITSVAALPCLVFVPLDVGVCPLLDVNNLVGTPALLGVVLSTLGPVGNYWTQWMVAPDMNAV